MNTSSAYSLVDLVRSVGTSLAGSFPMLLAYAAALVFIIMRWRQVPRASMLALCGVLLGLLLLVVMPVLYGSIPQRFMTSSNSKAELQSVYSMLSLIGSIGRAISFGLLFLAIYSDRRHSSPPPPPGY